MIKLSWRKRIVIIIGVLCAILVLFYMMLDFLPHEIYPIKSSPNTLSLVMHSVFYSNQPVITLKHYVNDLHICDYILTIKNGVRVQEPQRYDLPEIIEGRVEVNIELRDEDNNSLSITYENAADLYRNGLLIYLTGNNSCYQITIDGRTICDGYIYFVSGKEKTCYFKAGYTEEYSTEWIVIENAPPLKRIPRIEPQPFLFQHSGWQENEWRVRDINSSKP